MVHNTSILYCEGQLLSIEGNIFICEVNLNILAYVVINIILLCYSFCSLHCVQPRIILQREG